MITYYCIQRHFQDRERHGLLPSVILSCVCRSPPNQQCLPSFLQYLGKGECVSNLHLSRSVQLLRCFLAPTHSSQGHPEPLFISLLVTAWSSGMQSQLTSQGRRGKEGCFSWRRLYSVIVMQQNFTGCLKKGR